MVPPAGRWDRTRKKLSLTTAELLNAAIVVFFSAPLTRSVAGTVLSGYQQGNRDAARGGGGGGIICSEVRYWRRTSACSN